MSPRASGTAIFCGTSLFNRTSSRGEGENTCSLVGWGHFKICRESNNLRFLRHYDSTEWDIILVDKFRDLIGNCLTVVSVDLLNL
jgi:hypothetical protein